MTDAAHAAAAVAGAVGLGAILDHIDAVALCQRHQRIHLAGPAGEMHGDDCPCIGGDLLGHSLSGDVLGITIHIGKHRHRPRGDDAGDRCQEGTRGDDHLIVPPALALAFADPQPLKGQVQRHSSVGQSDSVFGFRKAGELSLELSAFLACPVIHLVGEQHALHRIGFF